MTIRDISVAFGVEVDKKSVSAAESAIKGMKSMATRLLGAIGIGFSIAGMANLAQAAADAEALKSQFSQVFGGMEQDAANRLDKIAADTGVLANRMKGSFAQIAAFAKTTGMQEAEALDVADRAMQAVADSAAFYDRSIEDATGSLRSFLKGNFENDAALGLSCTETTRNAAANALYGKSFKDLSEAQKQLTLLQMVEDANKASGALGQAARESDTWTNQLGNLRQSVTDLKAAAGSVFLQPAVKVLKILATLAQKATTALREMTGENGILTRSFERIHAIVKRLQPAVDRMCQTLSRGMEKGISVAKGVADKLGGVGNVLKGVAVAAGGFIGVLAAGKILDFAKAMGKLGFAGLKVMAIAAAVAILALVVEDFIQFMLGNDSLIGELFDEWGIGADNARQKICDAFANAKEFLLGVWNGIQEAASMAAGTVSEIFERHGGRVRKGIERAWRIIRTFLSGAWKFLSQLAATIFGDTEEEIGGAQQGTKEKMLGIWRKILDKLSSIWDELFETGAAVFNAIATVVETVFEWVQSFWETWGPDILSLFETVWNSMGGILSGFLEVVRGVANFISSVFTGDWQGAWEAIKEIFAGAWRIIKNVAKTAWETLKLRFRMGGAVIKSVWMTVWNAVKNFVQETWDKITSAVGGALGRVRRTIATAVSAARNTISTKMQEIYDSFSNTFSDILSSARTTFSNIKRAISTKVKSIKDDVEEGFEKAIDYIKELPAKAVEWGSDFIDGIRDGISTTISGIKDDIEQGFADAIEYIKGLPAQAVEWGGDFIDGLKEGILGGVGGIVESVKGIGEEIKSFLHFSVPDKGPLTDYESWMPDFMGGLAKGIRDNEGVLLGRVKGVADGIRELMQGATDAIAVEAPRRIPSVAGHAAPAAEAAGRQGNADTGNWEAIVGLARDAAGSIKAMTQDAASLMTSTAGSIKAVAQGAASSMSNATDGVKAIAQDVASFMPSAVGGIKAVVQDASSFIPSAASGIKAMTQDMTSFVSRAAGGIKAVAQGVSSSVSRAVGDLDGMARPSMSAVRVLVDAPKAAGGRDAAVDGLRNIAGGIRALARGATASAATAAASQINNTTSSMTQNVNINNSYSGGSAETQRNVSKAMKKSAVDATTYMARGLAYARG